MSSTAFKAGFAKTDITPPVGVELLGFGPYLDRKSTGVLDPLSAKAFVWEKDGLPGALVVCDLVGVKASIAAETRRLVEAACGIPADRLLLSCTHTHSGPATFDTIGWGEPDEAYLRTLPEKIAEAVGLAFGRLEDAELAYGEAAVAGIAYNREIRNEIVKPALEYGDRANKEAAAAPEPDKAQFGEFTDPVLKTLRVKRAGSGETIGFLAHYSCHPVVLCEASAWISADFVGLAVDRVGADENAMGLFVQGSIGDLNPLRCHEPADVAVQSLGMMAEKLAGFIREALDNAAPLAADEVAMKRIEIELPVQELERSVLLRNRIVMNELAGYMEQMPAVAARRVRFERDTANAMWERATGGDTKVRRTELLGIRFGSLLLVSHPTELFFAFHREIARRLAPCKTIIAGIANDYVGYVATPDKYETNRYSYPAYFAPIVAGHFPYVPNIGDILTDRLVELGQTLLNE